MRRKVTQWIQMGARPESAPLEVRRLSTERESHIEPELGQKWPDIDKLRWHAGVLLVDHGITLHVTETSRGLFALHGDYSDGRGSWGGSAVSFNTAWTYINGCAKGAELSGKGEE